jgi:hypothetical protein
MNNLLLCFEKLPIQEQQQFINIISSKITKNEELYYNEIYSILI